VDLGQQTTHLAELLVRNRWIWGKKCRDLTVLFGSANARDHQATAAVSSIIPAASVACASALLTCVGHNHK
jgi:hypothetical protein